MITNYHRPSSIEECLALLNRPSLRTFPLGGGTFLSHYDAEDIEVVDLQTVGLGYLRAKGNGIEIGAATTLQAILESHLLQSALKPALHLEAPLNIRNAATIAGTIVACDGRSTLATALLALDTKILYYEKSEPKTKPKEKEMNLGDYLPIRSPGLITQLQYSSQPRFSFDYVSRTPADKPILSIAFALWPTGRARIAVGGFGAGPLLALDGKGVEGYEASIRNALHGSTDDWASSKYRMDTGVILAKRCLQNLQDDPGLNNS
jgi:CO/xanthine dehydrogenase FAD-binding subunit